MTQYIVGNQIKLQVAFANSAGVPVDPDNVTAEVTEPSGDTIDLTSGIVRTGVGVYAADFIPTINGLHFYRFAASGALSAAAESSFTAQTMFPFNISMVPQVGQVVAGGSVVDRTP